MTPPLTFSWLDYSLFAGYVLVLVIISIRTKGEANRSEVEYLLAGRRLTVPAFVATMVSTWYGGILGVGEYSFMYGISNWLVFGVPYYLAAIIFALYITKPARASRLISIPDQLNKAYGKSPAIAGAMMVFVMTVPASYALMLGELLKLYFGGSLLLWLVVGTAASTLYMAWGGFQADVRTDKFQFVLMYAGFALMLGIAWNSFGGIDFLVANIPAGHFQWDGGRATRSIVVWYFLAMATLIEPSFYQRVYAAKSPKVARNGILISVLFWILFDFMSTFTGLYARALLDPNITPTLSYPLLAEMILPPGAKGLFFLGLLSVIMSTVDSYTFLAAQTLGRDIVARWRGNSGLWTPRLIQIGLLSSTLLAIGIAAWKQSVVGIWHDLGSIGLSVLLLPMLGSFKVPPLWARQSIIPAMAISGAVTLYWTFSKSFSGEFPLGIETVYMGLGSSLVVLMGWKWIYRGSKEVKKGVR